MASAKQRHLRAIAIACRWHQQPMASLQSTTGSQNENAVSPCIARFEFFPALASFLGPFQGGDFKFVTCQ